MAAQWSDYKHAQEHIETTIQMSTKTTISEVFTSRMSNKINKENYSPRKFHKPQILKDPLTVTVTQHD